MNINLLDDNQLAQLRQLIAESGNVVTIAHKSPDGDAIGASLAWALFLQAQGKQVTCVVPDAAPDFLKWLPMSHGIVRFDKHAAKAQAALDAADLLCCLDFNEFSRLGDAQTAVEACRARRLLIDHHMFPNVQDALSVSRSAMSSTSEMVFRLIWQLGGYEGMTQQMAQCIYCGMMTDTGGFTYNSTRPEIFFIVSQLLAKNIDKDEIYNRVYHNFSADAIKFRAYLIYKKLKVVNELHAAYYTVTKEEMSRFHFIKGDLEGVVNVPQQIKGLKLSISLREDTEKPNLIRVSLRSTNGFHCQPMAAQFFNGGGHADASGGKLMCSIEEAEQVTLRAIMAFKEQLQG